jgi:replicative DNA helicase
MFEDIQPQAPNLQINPPTNLEAEQRLVAAVLVEPTLLSKLPTVDATDFADRHCAMIWEIILELFRNGVVIDTPTILEALRPTWANAPQMRDRLVEFITGLIGCHITIHAAHGHAVIVRQNADKRAMIGTAMDYIREAQTSSPLEAADLRERFIGELSSMKSRLDGFVTGNAMVGEMMTDMETPREIDRTGLERLDDVLAGGFHRNRLYGFGGRPKAGKSLLLSTISYNMAMAGVPHAYLALESSPKEIVQGMAARHIRTNRLEFQKPQPSAWAARSLIDNKDFLRGKPLYFYGRPRMRLDELAGTIAKLGVRGKVRGVIVDYLQLVTGKDGRSSNADHLDNVSQTLAELAKNYNLWIACAFQLNRDGDARGGDGLMMACDMAFGINRLATDGREDEMWLNCLFSRYCPEQDLGDEYNGAFRLNRQHGPYFEEMPR